MTEFEDQLSRLKQMCEPDQQTWVLSPKDVAAIAMAVRVVTASQVLVRGVFAEINDVTQGSEETLGKISDRIDEFSEIHKL